MSTVTPRLRVAFFGTNGDFSLTHLQAIARRHDLVAVVDSSGIRAPNALRACLKRAVGRETLAGWAERHDVPYFRWDRPGIQTLMPLIKAHGPDVCCVASATRLIPAALLAVPRLGFVNVHPSLLPRYRGPNPWFWTYHGMDTEGGVTVHLLDEGEDTGDILCQATLPIPLGLPLRRLRAESAKLGARLLLTALDRLAEGTAERTPQRHLACPLRARAVRPGEDLVDWADWPIDRVYHCLRGMPADLVGLPPPGPLARVARWYPIGIDRTGTGRFPGRIGLDLKGWYLGHRDGRIRLWALPRWL